MGKFSIYNIPLDSLAEGAHKFEYILDDQYFNLIGDADSDIKRGITNVEVSVKRVSSTFEVNFTLNGEVYVCCDRCLDDMTVEIQTSNKIIVKFGSEYMEESDEVVIIPEDDGELNIAWFLYEFITLSVPMKRVHASGMCNKLMSTKLNRHRAANSSKTEDNGEGDSDVEEDNDTADGATDSRWDALKGLSDGE